MFRKSCNAIMVHQFSSLVGATVAVSEGVMERYPILIEL